MFKPAAIHIVHIGERPDAGSAALAEIVGEATLFTFGGGDQLRLSSLIGGTPLHRALVERYQTGDCVIAGTSAGAAVIPEVMIFQNNRFRMFRKGGIEMTKGLGLIRDAVFDTHFVQLSRNFPPHACDINQSGIVGIGHRREYRVTHRG